MHYLLVNYSTGEAVEVESSQPESAVQPPARPDEFHLTEADDVVVYQLAENDAGRPVKYHIDELVDELEQE